MITPCGVFCEKECGFFNNRCAGCKEIGGKVIWAGDYGSEICPIFDCAREKDLETCGHCSRVPCRIWFSTRDPSLEENEFNQQIALRLANLEKDRNE